ncbi:MAG TPA: YceI family protein [Chitinophagales bacterium]|nr:YceI family protein [Chitinophagales bacterium]HNM31797.1 YceI family protein [Chitinophagales bacterium]
MKKLTAALLAIVSTLALQAQAPKTVWNLDKAHSAVTFSVDHMVVSEVTGKFADFSAEVKADKPDFSDATGTFTVVLNSINTDNEKRDAHLRSADFFEVEKYPNMNFAIKKFTKVNGKIYKVTGDLTLHGVTKTVTLNAKFGGMVKDPYGLMRTGIVVTGEIDRYTFGLKYNGVMEAGGLTIGKKVRIKVNLELTKAN